MRGKIVKSLKSGNWGVIPSDKKLQVTSNGKPLVWLIDEVTHNPLLDAKGNQRKVFCSVENLVHIGFQD